jgi:hypothetical protein
VTLDPTLTPVERRLIEAGTAIRSDAPTELEFLHTVLCQTGLPYRDPGAGLRAWDRRQGHALLAIEAGRIIDPKTGEFVPVGLPFGEKARLVLIHLVGEALRTQSARIEVEGSLTAFVSALGLTTDGRTIRTVKDQLARLSVATVRLALLTEAGRATQVNGTLVRGLDLWAPQDPRQRVLWPTMVELSADFFQSVQAHAVPLDRRAIGALAHSALALDIYCWLAQRLYRVTGNGQPVSWQALHAQFGPGYARVRDFRGKFREALRQVLTVYPDARLTDSDKGLMLLASPTPVPGRQVLGWTPPETR